MQSRRHSAAIRQHSAPPALPARHVLLPGAGHVRARCERELLPLYDSGGTMDGLEACPNDACESTLLRRCWHVNPNPDDAPLCRKSCAMRVRVVSRAVVAVVAVASLSAHAGSKSVRTGTCSELASSDTTTRGRHSRWTHRARPSRRRAITSRCPPMECRRARKWSTAASCAAIRHRTLTTPRSE